jgi:putative transcription factor
VLCELCGDKEAKFKVVVEDSELSVCDECKTPESIEIPAQKEVIKQVKIRGEEWELLPDFGKRVRKGRKEKEIGRGDLAFRLGIKESFLSRIEKGELEPEDALVRKIERELDVKLRGKIDYKMTPKIEKRATTLGDIVELK